ncbi:glucosyl transferase [Alicycliphilus sp. B1]|nr:glucosyl transferase [Alicycliphilus sp. B1]
MTQQQGNCALSVVVPVFNEDAGLVDFHRRLTAVLDGMEESFEVVYVDDGSTDQSHRILKQLRATDTRISLVRLSRNFGKELALTAGLRTATGEAVILMDADLQHPPEVIPAMLKAWGTEDVDMVNMRRRSRDDESWIKRTAARAFYSLINRLSDVHIPADVGDFRLLSRRAVDALNRMDERNRFMKGLFAWIGFRQVTLDYDVEERFAGTSKWRFRQLWNFAVEGLVAFSITPLKLASYVGMVTALMSFIYGSYFLVKALFMGDPVQGFPTLIVTVLFLGGLQLMATGIVGEYLGRLCVENKRRPLYLVEEYIPAVRRPRHGVGERMLAEGL